MPLKAPETRTWLTTRLEAGVVSIDIHSAATYGDAGREAVVHQPIDPEDAKALTKALEAVLEKNADRVEQAAGLAAYEHHLVSVRQFKEDVNAPLDETATVHGLRLGLPAHINPSAPGPEGHGTDPYADEIKDDGTRVVNTAGAENDPKQPNDHRSAVARARAARREED